MLGLARRHKSHETLKKISEALIGPSNPNWGKHFSEEHRRKISESNIANDYRGDKSPRWRGGRRVRQEGRQTFEYKEWKKAVLARDNRTCVLCGDSPVGRKMIHVHHVKSFIGFPELRWDMNNGMTLCKKCHHKEHKWLTKEERDCNVD